MKSRVTACSDLASAKANQWREVGFPNAEWIVKAPERNIAALLAAFASRLASRSGPDR
jgi:hypothetical protein